jgi:hypothetical protein
MPGLAQKPQTSKHRATGPRAGGPTASNLPDPVDHVAINKHAVDKLTGATDSRQGIFDIERRLFPADEQAKSLRPELAITLAPHTTIG